MTKKPLKKIIIVAGETSGDIHAANLVKELKSLHPNLALEGLGGPKMAEAGVTLYQDMTKIAVMGFIEVLLNYGKFRKAFYLVLNKIKKNKPDAVVLVDFPGFNLKLATKLQKSGIKVIYYISPKVWAWKEKRVEIIRKHVHKMLVLFDFEKTFYARHGVNVSFVGNPLVDHVQTTTSKEKFLTQQGLEDFKLTIGLLPGSRKKEIEKILPSMAEAMEILKNKYPQLQFLIVKAPSIEQSYIEKYLPEGKRDTSIVNGNTYDAINACDLCMVTSGTATLETGILQKPMVIVYRTSLSSYLIGQAVLKIRFFGLVNIIFNKSIVPELLQHKASGENIARELELMFTDEIKLAEIKSNLKKIPLYLGSKGASKRAAQEVLETIN
jgi:lipid-A-disaccharide synthase